MEEGSERDMGDNVKREEEGKTLGEELVMDTPERGRINAPLFKFEDSPVFNYINNLSPLETVRPIRISQAFNSYSFSSVPSIFTSPHVSSHKETKFLRRYSVSGPSNTTFSSENENKVCSNEGLVDIAHKSKEQKESIDVGGCIDESLNEEKFENETPQNQNNSAVNCHDINKICVPSELSGSSSSLIPFGFLSNSEQNREVGRFDWAVISAAADFLIFPSPDTNANSFKGSFLKPLDSESRMLVSNKAQDDGFVGEESTKTENTLFQTGESQLNAIEADEDVPALTRINNQVTEVSNKLIVNESTCNLPRGMKRRCLVYDMGGARRKLLDEGSSSSSSVLSKCPIISNENHPIPSKPNNNSSRCIVPGIGLHLNALARNSKDDDNNQEILATPRQIINDFGPNTAPANFVNTQDIVNQSLASVDRDVISVSGDILNQSSPKKKCKEENGGETESCKRCNCKKSKCLKLYCECFAAGVYCVEPCSCQDCFNKPIHEDTVLATRKQIESRNPLAFAPKVIRTTDFVPETADESSNTPASARHKRGCNCKKSGCLKKYCECYQGGVGCSINCRCEGCKNVFGRKDGTHIVLADTDVVETEIHEKSVVDRNLSKHIIQNNAEPYQDSALPETPMHFNWAPLHHPFSVKNKPLQALLPMGSSSSKLYNGQKFGIPAFLQPHTQIEKQVQNISKNEIPENLRSPISGIKSCSPNSKRVSPPHNNFESSLSPARTSNRKLILRSIPSFPSLKD